MFTTSCPCPPFPQRATHTHTHTFDYISDNISYTHSQAGSCRTSDSQFVVYVKPSVQMVYIFWHKCVTTVMATNRLVHQCPVLLPVIINTTSPPTYLYYIFITWLLQLISLNNPQNNTYCLILMTRDCAVVYESHGFTTYKTQKTWLL